MAKVSRDLAASAAANTPLHPRENLFLSSTLTSAVSGAAVQSDGCGSFVLNLNGTFSGTARVEGFDGQTWVPMPMRPVNVAATTLVVSATAAGTWVGNNPGFSQTRVACTVYTSGTIAYVLTNSLEQVAPLFTGATIQTATTTGVAAAAVTLTIASPGAGLRHYITGIRIERHTSALLTAAATPTVITTTNIPTSLAYSIPADAAPQGQVYQVVDTFPGLGIATAAQATATTIVAGGVTGVIWRITAQYYIAP